MGRNRSLRLRWRLIWLNHLAYVFGTLHACANLFCNMCISRMADILLNYCGGGHLFLYRLCLDSLDHLLIHADLVHRCLDNSGRRMRYRPRLVDLLTSAKCWILLSATAMCGVASCVRLLVHCPIWLQSFNSSVGVCILFLS